MIENAVSPDGTRLPKLDQSVFTERVQKLRSRVVERIKNGEVVSLPSLGKHGDDLLHQSACMEALQVLCRQEGLDPATIRISLAAADDLNVRDATQALLQLAWMTKAADSSMRDKMTFYQQNLAQYAIALGVELPPEVYDSPPRLWPAESGPLRAYDEEQVEYLAHQFKTEIGNRQIVVIGQSGSAVDKRLNDSQLVRLAEVARAQNPAAYIIVVSDKAFLRQRVKEVPNKPTNMLVGFPVSERPSSSEQYTPTQVEDFLTELQHHLSTGDGSPIDRLVETTDLNELLAYLRIAEVGVFTDSFWMHLASTQEMPTLIALFTRFNPRLWAHPGTTVVESAALEGTETEMISSLLYRQTQGGEGDDNSGGIKESDVDRLAAAVVAAW